MKRIGFFAGLSVVAATACGGGSSDTITIAAGDTAALEAAVANPANAGKRIELAVGTYAITRALTLQTGMTLAGKQQYVDHDKDGVWDPIDANADSASNDTPYVVAGTETILDGSARTDSNMIRIVEGATVEGITLRGANKVTESANTFGDYRFLILSDGLAAATAPMRVRNTLIERSYHAIGFFPDKAGLLAAEVDGVVMRDNTEGLVGAPSASNLTVDITLTKSRIAGGLFTQPTVGETGIALSIAGANDAVLKLNSTGNIIEQNSGVGVFATAAMNFGAIAEGQPPLPSANRNRVEWNSTNDAIWRNGSVAWGMNVAGGVTLMGAFDLRSDGVDDMDNKVVVALKGTRFAKDGLDFAQQNQGSDGAGGFLRADLVAVGPYVSSCTATLANNSIAISFDGVSSDNTKTGNPCPNGSCASVIGFGDATNPVTFTPTDPAAFTAANPTLAPPLSLPGGVPPCGP